MKVGGVSDAKEITDEVREVVAQARADVESKLGGAQDTFEPVSYASQVVAGMNYFVKIHVGGDRYVHARIYRDLQKNVSVAGVQSDKAKEDAIEHF